MTPLVVVVGDVGVDVQVDLSQSVSEVAAGHDARSRIGTRPGGAGGNAAAWLARFPIRVALLGRVGNDPAADLAGDELRRAGVDCRFSVDPDRPTCTVVVLVAPDGERTMFSDRGAGSALHPDDVRLPQDAAGHLHLSGYVLFDPGSRPAGLAALGEAAELGWTTSVDPQSARHIADVGADTFLGWLGRVDLLLPNSEELAALGGPGSALRAAGAVAVTAGADGASWLSGVEQVEVPAPAVRLRDATGAGDAFNAGFLASWLSGSTPPAALAAGVEAGARAVGQWGARPNSA